MSTEQEIMEQHLREQERQLDLTSPGWRDDIGAIREYAHEIGLTDAELGSISDARAVRALREAASARKQTQEPVPQPPAARGAEAAKKQFEKTHSVKDAGKFLSRTLFAGERSRRR